MEKIYYEKRGRRYVPVAENDYDMFEALPVCQLTKESESA